MVQINFVENFFRAWRKRTFIAKKHW